MKFIASVDDARYASFMQRTIEAFGEELPFTRINITPDNVPVAPPRWWQAAPDRWAHVQAILAALKQAKEAGENCEFYEDDCVFAEDFRTKYDSLLENVPEDWDMIYLGGQLLAQQFYPLQEVEGNDTVLLCKNAHRNHAWLCKYESIQELIDWLEADNWPCHQTSDWRIGYLQIQDDYRVYIPKTGWICGQGENFSILDQRKYPDRWWHFTEPEMTREQETWKKFDDDRKAEEEKAHFEAWKAEMEAKMKENEKETNIQAFVECD